MKIKKIKSIEILDSRGNPTLRTFVFLDNGCYGVASVPSGASTGIHEALELRDGDKGRYSGKGVKKAVDNVNSILSRALKGKAVEMKTIDKLMIDLDGTKNKSYLGANSILSVSMALARAISSSENIPLWQFINQYYFKKEPAFPRLMTNIVNGGKHANWNFDIQEFIISPRTDSPSKAVRISSEIFHQLGKDLKKLNFSLLVGDEGGYSPLLSSNEEVFKMIIGAGRKINYKNGKDYQIAIDAAASEFYKNGKYLIRKTGKRLSGKELRELYLFLREKYKIFSFEDPFAEDDWENFSLFTKKIGNETIVVGDDNYVTNPKRIEKGIRLQATNAVLIKLNQIGSLTETIKAIKLTKKAEWQVVVSHRSGETSDSFIADLAYASGAEFMKSGSVCRSERLAKYNRLIEIENHL